MAIKSVEQTQNVGNDRAIALLHALRDPSILDHLAPEDRKRAESFGSKHHTDLTHADALWMAETIGKVVAVEPPRTKTVEMDDGVNPAAK